MSQVEGHGRMPVALAMFHAVCKVGITAQAPREDRSSRCCIRLPLRLRA